MIVVTGATGKLGVLVVDELLKKVPAKEIAVAVRNPEKAKAAFGAKGVEIRLGDYAKPETWTKALAGADKVLLISSSEVGQRAAQHQTVIDAARAAGVKLLAYTGILHGDRNEMKLADEHKTTEAAIRASGLPFVFLRNGWYLENYTANFAPALDDGVITGSAGDGKIAAAGRVDYAAAAATVLTSEGHANQVYELAGDTAFTMSELAAELSKQAKKSVHYSNVSPDDHAAHLQSVGLPAPVAAIFADADANVSRGALDDKSGDLHRLIGHATMPLEDAVAAALKH